MFGVCVAACASQGDGNLGNNSSFSGQSISLLTRPCPSSDQWILWWSMALPSSQKPLKQLSALCKHTACDFAQLWHCRLVALVTIQGIGVLHTVSFWGKTQEFYKDTEPSYCIQNRKGSFWQTMGKRGSDTLHWVGTVWPSYIYLVPWHQAFLDSMCWCPSNTKVFLTPWTCL